MKKLFILLILEISISANAQLACDMSIKADLNSHAADISPRSMVYSSRRSIMQAKADYMVSYWGTEVSKIIICLRAIMPRTVCSTLLPTS